MRRISVILAVGFLLATAACPATDARAAGGAVEVAGEATGFKGLLERARLERSGGDYGEAARLYALALKAAPPEQKDAISVELAVVLGWSKDYDGAIEVFSGVLEADPFNREARLGQARTYGWARDYERSKAEYRTLLAEDPGSTEARIGLARVYSWEGSLKAAADIYREVLAEDPGNKEARLALSRALWWGGDIEGALAEAGVLVKADPADIEALRLERKLRGALGPELGAMWSRSSDSDANELATYRASGYFNISPLLRLNVDYSRLEASRHAQKAHADIVTVRDSVRVSKDLTFIPKLSFVSTGSGAGGSDYVAGGLSAHWDFYRETTAVFSFDLSPLLDTPTLIENDITVFTYSAAVIHHRGDVTASLRAAFSDYSDDNTSTGLRGNIAWKAYGRGPDVIVGYIPEYRSFSEKTNSGYYNPGDIISHDLYLTLSGRLYMDALEYELTGTAGLQSTDAGSDSTSSFKAMVTGRLTRGLSAWAGYKWSRSALESPTGFRYEEFRAGLDYLF